VDYVALAERRVEQQIMRGDPFDSIETYINQLALDRELKDALWLLAWAELPRHERRQVLQVARSVRDDSQALREESAQAKRQSHKVSAATRRIAQTLKPS
jgi:hypothetical protein